MGNTLSPPSTRPRRLMHGVPAVLAVLTVPLLAGQVPTAQPEDVGFSSERLPRIHEAIQRHVDAGDITGAVTLVARQGHIAHFEAHGVMDIESNTLMRKDAVFRLMSMTKPVTAVAVLMMLEEGKLRLNDRASTFVPAFKDMKVAKAPAQGSGAAADSRAEPTEVVPANREITIRDLLTHTSGMVRNADRTPADSLATYVPRLAAVPLAFQPGTQWAYSGLAGPDVLALVVEIVSGQSYDEFVRARIFEPLGMKDTMYYPSDAVRPRVVTLYRQTEQGFEKDPDPDRISSTTLARICWVRAPRGVRFPPQILRLTTAGRMACSARQLVASTSGAHKKAHGGHSRSRWAAKRWAAGRAGAASMSRLRRASRRPWATARPCSVIACASRRSRSARASVRTVCTRAAQGLRGWSARSVRHRRSRCARQL